MDQFPTDRPVPAAPQRQLTWRSVRTIAGGGVLALVLGLGAAGAAFAADPSASPSTDPSTKSTAPGSNGNGTAPRTLDGKLCDKSGTGAGSGSQGTNGATDTPATAPSL